MTLIDHVLTNCSDYVRDMIMSRCCPEDFGFTPHCSYCEGGNNTVQCARCWNRDLQTTTCEVEFAETVDMLNDLKKHPVYGKPALTALKMLKRVDILKEETIDPEVMPWEEKKES